MISVEFEGKVIPQSTVKSRKRVAAVMTLRD